MSAAAQNLFKRRFGYPPVHLVRVPARLELLGSLAESNQGLAMSVAVDKYLEIASAPRTDGQIELISTASLRPERFWISDLKRNPEAPWADAVKGVLGQLRQRGVNFSGCIAAIDEDPRLGACLGNSGALAVATALTVRRLYPFGLGESGATVPPKHDRKGELPPLGAAERMHFARLCHAAEPLPRGERTGLLDCISPLFGKAWHVMSIDFRFLTVEHAQLVGAVLVVCDPAGAPASSPAPVGRVPSPGEAHTLGSEAEIRQSCDSAARKLGAKSLRSVELSFLKANQTRLTPREFECARYVVREIQRVVHADRALREGDYRQFGQYLLQSDGDSRDFPSSSSEAAMLADLARAHRGCLGTRRLDCCGGGATVSLVVHHQAESFMQQMARQYEQRTTRALEPFLCQVVDGAEARTP